MHIFGLNPVMCETLMEKLSNSLKITSGSTNASNLNSAS